MIVADLIRLLQDCHPQAVVLIPADPSMGQACEPVSDVAAIAATGSLAARPPKAVWCGCRDFRSRCWSATSKSPRSFRWGRRPDR